MASPTITHRHVSGKPAGNDATRVYGTHWDDTHVVTGLENVDNTSDLDKPISTATQTALNAKQPLDATLTALAGVTTAADKVIYATGADTFATTDLTSTARTLIGGASASAMRTTLGVVIGTDVQAFDSDLSAVAALATTGLVARTGAGTAATRTLTAPAAGVTVSNGDGVSGNPTLALANDLSALEGLASTGIAVRTTTDTWAQRTLQAPAAGITITNPAGVAGDPTLVLANDLAAVEGLSGTGIARRTGVDTWSVGTAVSNSELATAAAYTLKGNATGSSATPTDISISALTAKTSPVTGDFFLMSDGAASGALKKVDATNVAAASGVSSVNSLTGAVAIDLTTNPVVNPDGIIWQLQNTGAAAITDGAYAFDQWYGLTQSNGITASQLVSVEDSTPFMMRLSQANASAQRFGIAQAIERKDIIARRSQTVVLSARVRMSASTTLRYAILEWTGTADSPTKDVVNDWTSGTFTAGNFFLGSNLTITATGSTALTANTLTTVSVSGTFGSSLNNVYVFFWTDSTQAQNVTLDIAKVKLERGSTATAYAPKTIARTLAECQRFYEKSYDVDTAPGTNGATAQGLSTTYLGGNSIANGQIYGKERFQTAKRIGPTVTIYGYAGATGKVSNSGGTDLDPSSGIATSNGQTQFIVLNNSGGAVTTTGNIVLYHWVADARF